MRRGAVICHQIIDLVLGEKPDAKFRAAVHDARHRRQSARDQSCKRRLAIAVSAKKADPVLTVEPEVEVPQHREAVNIADGGPFEAEKRWRQADRAAETGRRCQDRPP